MEQRVSYSWLLDLEHADPIVIGTLYLLLALSLLTWSLIVYKSLELWRTRKSSAKYARWFREQGRVLSIDMGSVAEASSPLVLLTAVGVDSLRRYESNPTGMKNQRGTLSEALIQGLDQAVQRQLNRFESGLGILATIGNTAPFIGLFGTVIGIMSALKGISRTGSAGLDVVAGPIGEALIATAAGIACAVPAVIGYNTLVRRLKYMRNAMESFAYDLLVRIMTERATSDREHSSQKIK